MPEKLIVGTDGQSIEHYGVKGMHWGVRRYRSTGSKVGAITKKALVGDEKRSLATARGRAGFKKNVEEDVNAGKKLLNKLLKNKTFKATVYNHEGTKALAKSGKGRVKSAVRSFEKKQLKAQKDDIARLKKQGKTKEAQALQKEIDDVYGKDLSRWED